MSEFDFYTVSDFYNLYEQNFGPKIVDSNDIVSLKTARERMDEKLAEISKAPSEFKINEILEKFYKIKFNDGALFGVDDMPKWTINENETYFQIGLAKKRIFAKYKNFKISLNLNNNSVLIPTELSEYSKMNSSDLEELKQIMVAIRDYANSFGFEYVNETVRNNRVMRTPSITSDIIFYTKISPLYEKTSLEIKGVNKKICVGQHAVKETLGVRYDNVYKDNLFYLLMNKNLDDILTRVPVIIDSAPNNMKKILTNEDK